MYLLSLNPIQVNNKYFLSKRNTLIRFLSIDKFLSPLLLLVGILAPAFHPSVTIAANSYYQEYFADFIKVIYDLCQPEIQRSYEFGLRIAGLVIGWFVILFIIELVLRVILWIVRLILHPIYLALGYKKDIIPEEAETKKSVSVEGIVSL
jgi:hypothetical protein